MRKIIKIIKAFEDSKGNYLEPGFKGNVISHNRKSMEVRWANGEESVVDNIKKPLFDVSGGDVIDVSSLDNFILSFERPQKFSSSLSSKHFIVSEKVGWTNPFNLNEDVKKPHYYYNLKEDYYG